MWRFSKNNGTTEDFHKNEDHFQTHRRLKKLREPQTAGQSDLCLGWVGFAPVNGADPCPKRPQTSLTVPGSVVNPVVRIRRYTPKTPVFITGGEGGIRTRGTPIRRTKD